MARGTSLSTLVDMLRAEVRQSADPALGQNYRATLSQIIQRVQSGLYEAFDWTFLMARRYTALQAGQRYYALPADMPLENVIEAHVRIGSRWVPIHYGITDADQLLYDNDVGTRCDPIIKWAYIDGQVEAWPIPASNGAITFAADGITPTLIGSDFIVRWRGKRSLAPLLADSDVADLDDTLIVLFAAAEILLSRKEADANAKGAAAKARYEKLTGKQIKTSGSPIIIGGGVSNHTYPRRILFPIWKA